MNQLTSKNDRNVSNNHHMHSKQKQQVRGVI